MSRQQTRRILLVDDRASVRHELARVLTEEGVGDCREAAGRGEALDIAGREPPDMALVDLSPDDALELVEDLSGRQNSSAGLLDTRGAGLCRVGDGRGNWRPWYALCSPGGCSSALARLRDCVNCGPRVRPL